MIWKHGLPIVHVKVSSSIASIWKKKHICWIQLFI
jgi:hypothetical protein